MTDRAAKAREALAAKRARMTPEERAKLTANAREARSRTARMKREALERARQAEAVPVPTSGNLASASPEPVIPTPGGSPAPVVADPLPVTRVRVVEAAYPPRQEPDLPRQPSPVPTPVASHEGHSQPTPRNESVLGAFVRTLIQGVPR